MLEQDIPWALDLGRRRYGERFDVIATEGWFRNLVLKGPMVFLPIRTADAFLVAMVTVLPWFPADWECNVILICAEEGALWQACALARVSIDWARKRRCVEWRISSETEFSVQPIARRVGAEELTSRYRKSL